MFALRNARNEPDELTTIARPEPHEDAIFSLMPLNEPANAILRHKNNRDLVSRIRDTSGKTTYGLNIGPFIRPRSTGLVHIGRLGDIVVEGQDISRCHLSFEQVRDTGAIMLRDRSSCRSTQTYGEDAHRMEDGRIPRQVMVSREVNLTFGFGGADSDRIKFQIVWHDAIQKPRQPIHVHVENPFLACTIAGTARMTVPPTGVHTPIHTSPEYRRVRWLEKATLGHGSFGNVWSAWNIDSGELFAVKVVRAVFSEDIKLLKRELETLRSICHPHIVQYIGGQYCPKEKYQMQSYEIFTELKDGNVSHLIEKDILRAHHTESMFHEMLQALDYLAALDIIHRDVKPDNILFKRLLSGSSPTDTETYVFQLADFGLANVVSNAGTVAGTYLWMAPEVNPMTNLRNHTQSSKADIWSLLVTVFCTFKKYNIMRANLESYADIITFVREIASKPNFENVRDMVEQDPDRRPSAAELLDRLFQGKGKCVPTRRNAHVLAENNNLAGLPRRDFGGVRKNIGSFLQNDAQDLHMKFAAQNRVQQRRRHREVEPPPTRKLRIRNSVVNYAV